MIQDCVGISFRPTKNPKIKVGSSLQLVHDQTNKYSSRAIAIQFEGVTLGYIGEKGNLSHEEIFNALPLEGKVNTVSVLLAGEEFAKFSEGEITHLEVSFPMSSDTNGKIKSFNEDFSVKFLKVEHRYLLGTTELLGASKYIKRWIADFDQKGIARVCANQYGCSIDEVLGFWAGSGHVAAAFGTSIHNALEHFEKFKVIGEIVQNKKGLDYNKALPTHPALRKIVEEFYAQKLQDGKVLTEVLVTNVERGLCGTIDRLLITGDKKCRVQDYKINIGAEEVNRNMKFLGQMATLPKTKLSKYQLQLSFYARLLQLSGWEVSGLDVYVYENEWKLYQMDILKLDF